MEERGVSPVIGVVLLIAVAVILSALVLGAATGFLDVDSNPTAAANVDYESESIITVQLASMQNADKVIVRSALGTEYVLNSVGDTQEILNIEGEGQMAVIAVKDGERTVVQKIEPHSFNPDYVVTNSSNLQSTINTAASDGEARSIVAVKRGTYQANSVDVYGGVILVGEDGTVIEESASDSAPLVQVRQNSQVSNIEFVGDGGEAAVKVQDTSTVTSVDTQNGGVSLVGDNATSGSSNVLVDRDAIEGVGVGGGTESSGTSVSLNEVTTSGFYNDRGYEAVNAPTTMWGNKSMQSFNVTVEMYNDDLDDSAYYQFYDKNGNYLFRFVHNMYGGLKLGDFNGKTVTGVGTRGTVTLSYTNKTNTLKVYQNGKVVYTKKNVQISFVKWNPGGTAAMSARWNGTVKYKP